jgi:tetratricopeptide (TPR) repeat protein
MADTVQGQAMTFTCVLGTGPFRYTGLVQAVTIAGGRYRLGRTIGEGGMGIVYEAADEATGHAVALKRLLVPADALPKRDVLTALFQREYRTLSQLKHPSVIDVYDYGVDDAGPFYTMELLAGEDLRALIPIPFARACALLHGVASALCLLHTRQLLHRDITSRNIRVLSATHAKLLDFGALAPMGYSGPTIGTAPFSAPEALFSQPLDARSDLFSLGAVLYQSLCGVLPYRGRDFEAVRRAWAQPLPTVHELVPEVPLDLSQLVMSMIALDRAARPRDAAHIVERLAAIAKVRVSETPGTAKSYLVAPNLVGREPEIQNVREALANASRSLGAGLAITGPPGVGRSRLLQAAALEATLAGASVLSVGPSDGDSAAFSVAQRLAEALLQTLHAPAETAVREQWDTCSVLFSDPHALPALPPLARFETLVGRRADVMTALRTWFLSVCRDRLLVICVDDADRIDEPSAAWLATLLQDLGSSRILVLSCVCDLDRTHWAPACSLLSELSHELVLGAFRVDQLTQLVEAVFGSVPHVDAVSRRIFHLSQGIARDAIGLCEHLVDSGVVSYREGTWALPAQIDDQALPESMAAAHARLVATLSAGARTLAATLALATEESLTLQDCVIATPGGGELLVRLLLEELTLHRVVATNGYRYRIVHVGLSRALLAALAPQQRADLHLALAEIYRLRGPDPIRVAHHLFQGAKDEQALDILLPFIRSLGQERLNLLKQTTLDARHLGALFERAIEVVERLHRPHTELVDLQYFMMMLGLFVDASWFESLRPTVLAELKSASGYLLWQQEDPAMSAMDRIVAALQRAQVVHESTPVHDRSYDPEQAIRALVQFTGAATAVGAQTCDWPMRRESPDLLRPFVCLSPLINAMFENALSVADLSFGRFECFRNRALRVLEMLSDPAVQGLEHLEEIRAAVTYGLSSAEARLGKVSLLQRLSTLADHPRLRSNAMDLQAYVYLQQGDWARAKACKRRAEQLGIEGSLGQMFSGSTLRYEAEVYALGGDIGAVKHLLGRLKVIAQKHPGWLPSYYGVLGDYERLRGEPMAALKAYEDSLALLEPLMTPEGGVVEWYSATAGKIAMLADMERFEEAVAYGEQVLTLAGAWSTDGVVDVRVHGVLLALALADSSLGRHARAVERLNAAIDARLRLDTSGVYLAILYEARTRVAYAAGDAALYQESERLACEEFSRCEDSGFASRRAQLLALGVRRDEAKGLDAAERAALRASDDSSELKTKTSRVAGLTTEGAQRKRKS